MKDLKYYLKHAMKENFALGAFNFSNLETLQAITAACKQSNSPAIVAVSESALKYMGEYLRPLVKAVKENYAGIFIHLDHGKNLDVCKQAIDIGFDSVMIDGSGLPFEENVASTKSVCEYAHKRGVLVEGELGQIKGVEDKISAESDVYTNPAQAQIFAMKTGVDMLAISIGTSHGIYKHGGNKLRFDILEEIESLLPSTPLVLHGASVVPGEQIEEFTKNGGMLEKAGGIAAKEIIKAVKNHNIVKINSDTDIRLAFSCGVREILMQNPSQFDPRIYLGNGREKATKIVKDKIENLLFSKDKI